MVFFLLISLTLLFSFLVFLYRLILSHHVVDYTGKHVLVTGGSSGIGKYVGLEFARRGARVTLLARTESKLRVAVSEIRVEAPESPGVGYVCGDVTDFRSVRSAVDGCGPIDVLVACAGAAEPGYFLEQDIEVFERQMRLNYLGSVCAIKAVAPSMCARREGHIVLVASAAAVVSFIGYSSYSPTKFALRGLADSLRNEFCGFNVSVSIAYPPDTDTPGFVRENKTKPVETLAISPPELYDPKVVARTLVSSMSVGDYHLSSPDVVQNLLVSTMSGVSPRRYLLLEALLQPFLVIIEAVFYHYADYHARKYGKRKKKKTL